MNERLNAIVGARISEFRRKMAQVRASVKTLPKNIVIEVEERFGRTQRNLDRLANTIRTLQTIGGNMVGGSFLALSPSLIPIVGGLTAALAMLGPMLAVTGAGAFGMATAFSVAGAGIAAFATLAIPTLARITSAQEAIAQAEEELASADSAEKRAEALAKLEEVYAGLSKSQLNFIDSSNKFKSFWGEFVSSFEAPMLDLFAQGLNTLQKALNRSTPVFEKSLSAMNTLMQDLDRSLKNPTIVKFINYLSANVEPIMTKLGRGLGNFGLGLMDLMRTFKPITDMMVDGFLEMGRSFADWAKGLEHSKKFQSFVEYVKTNLPKVRKIFGDTFMGIVNLFTAFGPLSADMMTGLQNMMAKFREWTANLGSNQAFQGFIQYIRDNGPTVLEFIGQLVTLIANLVKAMAPVGAQMLQMVTNFLTWFNTVIENNPWVAKLIGYFIIFIGVFQAILPVIIAVTSFFGGQFFSTIASKVLPAITKLWQTISTKLLPFLTNIGSAISKVLPWITKIGGFFLRFLTGPIGIVIQIVILLATVIVKHWDEIKAVTEKVFSAVGNFFKNIWNSIKTFFTETLVELSKKAQEKMKDILNTIKEKMNSVWDTIKKIWNNILSFFSQIVSNIWNAVKSAFQNMFNSIKTTTTNIWNSISNIWNNIKSFFSNVASKIWDIVKNAFKNLFNSVKNTMNDVLSTVKNIWGNVMDFLGGMPKKMLSMGKDIVSGMISGVKNMAGKLVDSVKGVVSGAIEGAKKLLGINSPSKLFMGFGQDTFKGYIIGSERMASKVASATKGMGTLIVDSFQSTPVPIRTNNLSIDSQISAIIGQSIDDYDNGRGVSGHGDQHFHFHQPNISPSEAARKFKQTNRQLAWEANF